MDLPDDREIQDHHWMTPSGPALVDRSSDIQVARDRAAALLRERATRPGVLARRLMGRPLPGDERLVDQLIRERRRRTRIDGSVDGGLLSTAWIAWELMDLGCPADHAAMVRTIGFVLGRQDRPGRFGEGCDDELHAAKCCHHFLRGFFSPSTREEMLAPLVLRSGLIIDAEENARLAASLLALRVVLRAEQDCRHAVCGHVETLMEMSALWDDPGTRWPVDLTFLGLGALAFAPLQYRPDVERIAVRILEHQEADGSWRSAHLFNAINMLMSFGSTTTRNAVKRAIPLVLSAQTESGAFDAPENEELVLIGLRALRLAEK